MWTAYLRFLYVSRRQRLSCDAPVSALDLFDDDAGHWRISGGLPCDVVIVLDVVLKRADFDVGETGRFQELERLLLAPHCAQTHAALRKRGRHAVHARNRVKQRSNRVIAIFRNGAGSSNVLHKEDASRFEASANAGKDVIRARLVMNRVKGRNKVVSRL